jgi:uncharacterized protein (DUF433 family)
MPQFPSPQPASLSQNGAALRGGAPRNALARNMPDPDPAPGTGRRLPQRLAKRLLKAQTIGSGMKTKINGKPTPVELGQHIVADPKICHGKPTFKGTRIMVFQVLEQVAYGTPWERIAWSWRGKVSMEAITEAVKLASELFKDQGVFKPHAHTRRKHLRNRSLAPA